MTSSVRNAEIMSDSHMKHNFNELWVLNNWSGLIKKYPTVNCDKMCSYCVSAICQTYLCKTWSSYHTATKTKDGKRLNDNNNNFGDLI